VDARFRNYLFPALIVAVLIWLAVQTLGSDSGDKTKIRWSDAVTLVRTNARSIDHAMFRPSKHEVEFRLRSGRHEQAIYPVDESAYALQQLLEKSSVPFDAKSPGSSAWWSLLTGLLPFVILLAFWAFLIRRVRKPADRPDART
jgi:ATP-dependent Zn protease